MLELRHFDDSQVVVLRSGKLIATLTGPDRVQNALAMIAADSIRSRVEDLVGVIDSMDGVATMPYGLSVQLAEATDKVRIAMGSPSRLKG